MEFFDAEDWNDVENSALHHRNKKKTILKYNTKINKIVIIFHNIPVKKTYYWCQTFEE